jgi:hypothetical protein
MMRKFEQFSRFIENYRHYRRKGLYCKDAWHLASMTLPQ